MNRLFKCFTLFSLFFLCACKKSQYLADNTATINVVNGIVQKDVLLKMNGRINNSGANSSNSRQNRVVFGASLLFYSKAEDIFIDFLNRTDSISLVSRSFDLKKGGIYTVLLAGVAPNAEVILVDDTNLPYVNLSSMSSEADSVINVRFINLAPDIANIDVRIKGQSSNEMTGLSYKSASTWKSYTAKSVNGSYLFEFVENGTVRGTQSLSITTTNRFKNVAVVLRGIKTPVSGQPALGVSTVNYFQ
jgi:hypothetical protein